MKNFIATLCMLVSSMLVFPSCASNSIRITLKGEVIDRPQSTHLILTTEFEDTRIHGKIMIPIIDGKFEYILYSEPEKKYMLLFNDEYEQGWMHPVFFFSEPGIVNFTLFPQNRFIENRVKGGELNTELWNYYHTLYSKIRAIDENRIRYLEDNYGEILKNLEIPDNDPFWHDVWGRISFLGNAGIEIERFRDSANEAHEQISLWRLQYAKENPTLVGYAVLHWETSTTISFNQFIEEGSMTGNPTDISPYIELYRTVFAPKFPNHTFTEQMEILLAGRIDVGMPFVDFTAPDLNGNPVTLSERISGRPAILNLWASWCWPCRRKAIELIPVYEEFRNDGFVVIGVAREREISHAIGAINRDRYPWKNLVELRDVGRIWQKYGLGNSGGAIFLIDENGIIVARNPTALEVRMFLAERFR